MTLYTVTVIFLGTYLLWIEFAFVFISLYRDSKSRIRDFLSLFLSLLIVFLLARISGLFYTHLQPYVEQGFSPIIYHAPDNAFPADHATLSSALGFGLFLVSKETGLIALIMVLGICVGRVLGGVHYPIDVLAGIVLGIVAAYLARRIIYFIRSYKQMGDN